MSARSHKQSARTIAVTALLTIGIVVMTGCGTSTTSSGPTATEPSSPAAGINPNLDLASLLPSADEVSFPSGSAADSDTPQPQQIPPPYGSANAEFDLRSCDGIGKPPYWPAAQDSSGLVYRDATGKAVATAAVTRFASPEAGTAVISALVELLNFCAEHSAEAVYGVDETIALDDANGIYGVATNNSVGEEVRYSALGPYFLYVRTVAPATADDAFALVQEVQSRIVGSG